jgi:hypothetical protein
MSSHFAILSKPHPPVPPPGLKDRACPHHSIAPTPNANPISATLTIDPYRELATLLLTRCVKSILNEISPQSTPQTPSPPPPPPPQCQPNQALTLNSPCLVTPIPPDDPVHRATFPCWVYYHPLPTGTEASSRSLPVGAIIHLLRSTPPPHPATRHHRCTALAAIAARPTSSAPLLLPGFSGCASLSQPPTHISNPAAPLLRRILNPDKTPNAVPYGIPSVGASL